MELIILDSNFSELGSIDTFNSLQWVRQYYDFGHFQINCGTEHFNLLDKGSYLLRPGYELGVIEELDYYRSESNEYSLTCKGRFVTAILNDRVVVGEKKFTGTHEVIAKQLLSENFITPSDVSRKVLNLSLGALKGLGESTSLEIKNDEIGDVLSAFLEEKELSQRIDYDYLENKLIYTVWQGLDRTENQSTNDWATFSDDFDNIADAEYSKNDSDYKNFIYVVGKDNLIASVNQVQTNERRKETVTSSYDSSISVLEDKGRQELKKDIQVDVINCTAISGLNLLYKRDFDLGDLCTVKIRKLDKVATMRITEVKEIYEDGEVIILPKFGDDFITIKRFIEREVTKK